jgi:serine phosphatase RsbU (regulator of sigma subunit)
LHTDAIIEAESPTGEQFSATRLAKIVSSHLQESANELIESSHAPVTEFQGTTAQADGMTLVVLKAL